MSWQDCSPPHLHNNQQHERGKSKATVVGPALRDGSAFRWRTDLSTAFVCTSVALVDPCQGTVPPRYLSKPTLILVPPRYSDKPTATRQIAASHSLKVLALNSSKCVPKRMGQSSIPSFAPSDNPSQTLRARAVRWR